MEICHSPRQCFMHSDSFCPVLDLPHQNIQVECRADLNKPAICWARMMIAKTYTWCIFMGKNCFRFSSNRLTKAWHPLAFTCLVPVSFFYTFPGRAGIKSLANMGCVLSHIWWQQRQESLTRESSQLLALPWLTKRMLFLSMLFLLFPDSLLPSRREFYFCHSWSSVIHFCDANREPWIDKETAWGVEGHPFQGERKKADTKQRPKRQESQVQYGYELWGRVEHWCGKGNTFRPLCCVWERSKGKWILRSLGGSYQSDILNIPREMQINTGFSFNFLWLLEPSLCGRCFWWEMLLPLVHVRSGIMWVYLFPWKAEVEALRGLEQAWWFCFLLCPSYGKPILLRYLS